MKHSVFAALFLTAAPVLMAQTTTDTTPDTTGPTVTITTPAVNNTYNVVISGTATDTGTTASPAGVRAVYYKIEGSSSWKLAQLTAKNEATTTWLANVKIKQASGKRVYIRAVDRSGNEGDVVGRRFRFGSS